MLHPNPILFDRQFRAFLVLFPEIPADDHETLQALYDALIAYHDLPGCPELVYDALPRLTNFSRRSSLDLLQILDDGDRYRRAVDCLVAIFSLEQSYEDYYCNPSRPSEWVFRETEFCSSCTLPRYVPRPDFAGLQRAAKGLYLGSTAEARCQAIDVFARTTKSLDPVFFLQDHRLGSSDLPSRIHALLQDRDPDVQASALAAFPFVGLPDDDQFIDCYRAINESPNTSLPLWFASLVRTYPLDESCDDDYAFHFSMRLTDLASYAEEAGDELLQCAVMDRLSRFREPFRNIRDYLETNLSAESPRIRSAAADALVRFIPPNDPKQAKFRRTIFPEILSCRDSQQLFRLFLGSDYFLELATNAVNSLGRYGDKRFSADDVLWPTLERFLSKLERHPDLGTDTDNLYSVENRLRRILRNAAIDEYRQQTGSRRKGRTAVELVESTCEDELEALELRDLLANSHVIVAAMGDRYSPVWQLHLNGHDDGEIAQLLNISLAAATKRLQRIRLHIQRAFRHLF